ncbi:mucosa-associated lymphoid tissue lymphoma translocation protein 1-like [Lineus longissimus]|uniref:mucosa-associated lymphoid tissue lymphoma translocation protein 1-like n=1 Tax=Lineus longissimus TaxID=88925 RepID=UPI002B4CE6CC
MMKMAQKKQPDPKLKEIVRSFKKEFLLKNILDLDGLIYQGVVQCTWRHWKEFLSYLQKRGTLTQRDVTEGRIGSGQDDNMERILNILAVKAKRVADLIDYLYHTESYSALRVFGIQIEAPQPVPRDIPPSPVTSGEYNVDDVTGYHQGHAFPPLFKEQPSEYTRVHSGQAIKFEPCYAEGAKRYQWFKAVSEGFQLQYESDTCGTFQIPEAKLTHAGTYICKAFNDVGSASSKNIRVHILGDQHQHQLLSPVISQQPQSVLGVTGEDVVFTCHATGRGPLTYQWYNSKGKLNGATQNELRLNTHYEDAYICVVTDADGVTAVSKEAKFQIVKLEKSSTGFTATSKVALLIGNGNYKTNSKLDAVYRDIPRLSHLLKNMGFQVVACYDLTVVEMKKVVTFFASLMMEGVYAFVYVVGHGHYYQGQNYLLAYDAHIDIRPDEDAFLIEWMLRELQGKTPALKAIFLDICRMQPKPFDKSTRADQRSKTTPDRDGDSDDKSNPVMIELPADKNTIICYATGEFAKSYEVHNEDPQSFFVACLMEALPVKEPLEFISFRVKQIMQKYCEKYKTLQYPVVKSSLADGRSLWDDVDKTGRTKEYQAGILQWESANILPPPLYLNIDRINIQVHLDFVATVTNQFRVVVTVMQNDVAEIPYKAYICDRLIPQGITAKLYDKVEEEVVGNGMKRTVTVFKNLQKLEDNLKVHLLLVSLPGPQVKVDYLLDFEKPMIAKINIWKSEGIFRQGIEEIRQKHKDKAN